MRSADGARLYVADEDHHVLRVLAIPFAAEPADPGAASAAKSAAPSASAVEAPIASASARPRPPASAPKPGTIPPVEPPPPAKNVAVAMPGAPAQVLPLDGFVLATVRDPGSLVILKETAEGGLAEEGRVEVPADAWGLALSKDERVAVVTSAWTHKVSGVDWRAKKVLWTLDVAREPRGVVIHPNGKTAYVSHLTSGDLTRIDGIGEPSATAKAVAFPAAPNRAPQGVVVRGSLGYAMVLDEEGHRLLAARHALGGLANDAWGGIPTIDVLQTENDTPLLAPRVPNKKLKATPAFESMAEVARKHFGHVEDHYMLRQFGSPHLPIPTGAQPRAMVVAKKTSTVWIASEGEDLVLEAHLRAAAPIEPPLRVVGVGRKYKDPKIIGSGYSGRDGIPGHCGAPSGLALSADESLLYVFCRSTYDIATIRLRSAVTVSAWDRANDQPFVTIARLAPDPGDETMSRGRRLFYGALDDFSSGGAGCASCHPDGRDDGHVWHETPGESPNETPRFLASKNLAFKTKEGKLGFPRQTPMLAGRVASTGPYGWHAQNATLRERLAEGFERHRWRGSPVDAKGWMMGERSNALAAFLRRGLVPPPHRKRDLTEQEKLGRQIFESEAAQCGTCHVSATEHTNRTAYSIERSGPPPGFEAEEGAKFKTPSLLFVGGTAPYYHDGRAPTLEALVTQNRDRMGKTSHLTPDARAALVAYLETL